MPDVAVRKVERLELEDAEDAHAKDSHPRSRRMRCAMVDQEVVVHGLPLDETSSSARNATTLGLSRAGARAARTPRATADDPYIPGVDSQTRAELMLVISNRPAASPIQSSITRVSPEEGAPLLTTRTRTPR